MAFLSTRMLMPSAFMTTHATTPYTAMQSLDNHAMLPQVLCRVACNCEFAMSQKWCVLAPKLL